MMKNIYKLIMIALLTGFLAACQPSTVQTAPNNAAQSDSASSIRSITVVGEGKVSQEPDIAVINIGASARAETASAAKAEVDADIAAIIAVLQDMDIAEKDIQTSHYSIMYEREQYPPMPELPAAETPAGYFVTNMLQVTVRNIGAAEAVLDAVVQAGANQVNGISYSVADQTSWQSVSRELAMADARRRAQELAELSEVELGEVQSVSEIIGGMATPFWVGESGLTGSGIAPGELELTTQIQVTFTIDG